MNYINKNRNIFMEDRGAENRLRKGLDILALAMVI